MARGGLWYLAMEDMRIAAIEANDHPFAELNAQETNALRRVFERGSRSWFEEGSEARHFAKLLNNFPPAVRSEMAGNLLLPVSYSLRRAFRDGATMREWIHLLRILRSFLSFSSISAYRRARGRPGGMPGVVTRKATLTRAATNDAPAC
jgi:hypothetical protein